jgi:hypothetical protein
MPQVGPVTVGSDLANSASGTGNPLNFRDLIVPNIGDTFETQLNNALQTASNAGPAATIPKVVATVGGAVAGGVGSAVAAGVGVVFSTIGTFLVDFVTGLISAAGNFKNSHLLALVVGLVVVVVLFR